MTPVRVHAADNVAVVAGEDGVRKIASAQIAEGAPVLRYGQAIGRAARFIRCGDTVREGDVLLPEPPDLDRLPLATAVPAPLPPLEGYTFDGYPDPGGGAATRNVLGVSTTVQCVAPTVEYAVRRIRDEILPRFPNVDDAVALTHAYGCGVAIDAPGSEIPIRTLREIARHANLGGTPLLVSLGCEKLEPSRLFPIHGPTPWVIRLQDQQLRGFGGMVAAICEAAEKRLAELDRRRRAPCPASALCVGLQCGGSDAFSGVTANPATGYAADLLVRCGATVMFSEVTEVRDAVHLLTPRCADEDVARALIREMRYYDAYLARGGADRSANPTPGNKRGGLANVVEKALGSIAKAGTSAIRAVAAPGEKVATPGLVFAATPASDFICGTQQLVSMNVHIFTTGEGTPYGLPLVPVVKVSSRTELARRWPDLIDFDAGPVATGALTLEQAGWDLFRLVLETASGRYRPWAERWRLHNALTPFNPAPVT
jgi:galactarate dehydratase